MAFLLLLIISTCCFCTGLGYQKATLPDLPYSYDALQPFVDARTMEIHHQKHHQAYIDKYNAALSYWESLGENTALLNKDISDQLTSLESVPTAVRNSIRNAGGGYYNHKIFWTMMASAKSEEAQEKKISTHLRQAISATFGSFENFQKEFSELAVTLFGSGWVWLSVDLTGNAPSLILETTANQDSPLSVSHFPILGIDVWEHAYYLHYQNRRAEYVDQWWNVVNWFEVSKRHLAATFYHKGKAKKAEAKDEL